MKLRSLSWSVMVFVAWAVSADVEWVSQQGQGTGATFSTAVLEALVDAVGRVNGVSVGSLSRHELSEALSVRDGRTTANRSEGSKIEVSGQAGGWVRSYAVLSQTHDEQGRVLVSVEAVIPVYQPPVGSGRLRLAVMPFRVGEVSWGLPEPSPGPIAVDRRLRHALVDGLTQTRKFAVVDHDFAEERAKELARLLEPGVAPAERARLGQGLGADYAVVGVIEAFRVGLGSVRFPASDRTMEVMKSRIEVAYRVVDVATGQIVFADSARRQEGEAGTVADAGEWASLLRTAGLQMSRRISSAIYPLKVIALGNEVVLNQGGNLLQPGCTLNVFNLGQRLSDPHTGEFLGYEEVLAASVQLTRVLPKTCYARIVRSLLPIRLGAVCRSNEECAGESPSPGPDRLEQLQRQTDELFK